MLADGAADSVGAGENTDTEFVQSVVDAHAAGREELLNLYCGTSDGRFVQSNREAEIPEGYNPVERGWYQQAAKDGTVIVTDPYWDVLTNQMCTTIAAPIYINGELAGVIGLDVTLGTVTDLTRSIHYTEGAYGFLADSSGQYVAHKNKEYEPTENTAVAVTDVIPGLGEILQGAGNSVKKFADYDGSICYFAVSGIESSSWKLGVVVPASNVTESLITMIVMVMIIALVIIGFVALFMAGLIGKMLAPVQMLKQFASGDFSKNVVSEKAIPREYKNETEQIKTATKEVKQQIRGIILNTKQEAESISTIAEGTSDQMTVLSGNISDISRLVGTVMNQAVQARELTGSIKDNSRELGYAIDSVAQKAGKGFAVVAEEIRQLADNSRQAVDKIRKVTENVVRNVTFLSESSGKLLEFMNGKVMDDYKGMTELAEMYQKDAAFYNDISGELGTSSQEMSASMEEINESIVAITELVGEIADSVQSVEHSAEDSNENSKAVMKQMEELFRLSELLNRTVAAFKI